MWRRRGKRKRARASENERKGVRPEEASGVREDEVMEGMELWNRKKGMEERKNNSCEN